MNAIALLCLVGIAHLAPEWLARIAGGTEAAWVTVCYGVEAAALWLLVAAGGARTRGELAVCAYGLYESIQRPVCRQLLPMDMAPSLKPGEYLCDAATGFPVSMLSPIVLCAVLIVVAQEVTKPIKVCSSNSKSDGA